jgi:AraC-like DNA-binding protein
MSRFYRARLPAPKKYLSMTRLLYAAWFLEEPRVSVAAAADVLRYSSPQSFGRHVRTTLGLTAAEFRREMPLRVTLDHYRSRLIDPYLDTLSWFRPLGPKLSGRDYEWDLAS